MTTMLWQPALPDRYLAMSDADLAVAIDARRAELGDDLLILGHHYQQDDVIRHADLTGDSLKLSQMAANEAAKRGTKFIVFCGVHFMAETADILTDDSVQVILPDLSAGCSMADMAAYDDTVDAWEILNEALNLPSPSGRGAGGEGSDASGSGAPSESGGSSPLTPTLSQREREHQTRIIPITYVNSSAAIKAFVGSRGGACCTSSNAKQVFEWALAGGTQTKGENEDIRILFLPDQHLGRNTASSFGLLTETDEAAGRGHSETLLWQPKKEHGGVTDEQIQHARVYLWAGHCSVHKLFRPEHIDDVRAQFKDKGGITVLVHPECAKEVVDKADLSGSTEFIIREIENAKPGSNWAVGTEIHLVARLAKQAADHGVFVRILSDCQCLCTTMYRIDPPHLLWSLDNLAEGKVVNRIDVHPNAKRLAKLALERMLAHTAPGSGGGVKSKKNAEPALVD